MEKSLLRKGEPGIQTIKAQYVHTVQLYEELNAEIWSEK